jgi:hypothetical protein
VLYHAAFIPELQIPRNVSFSDDLENVCGGKGMTIQKLLVLMLIASVMFIIGIEIGTASEVNLTPEGHFGGLIYAVEVSGNFAFIGQGQDFIVFDISNPTTPLELVRLNTNGFIEDIKISNNYAYVADGSNGLVIVDINDPSTPHLAGHCDTAGNARGIAVSGNYAYIADRSNGLVIVDINDSSTPHLAGHYDTSGRAVGIAVSGNYAYIADWNNGLVIVNISDPSTPYLAGHCNTAGYAYGIAVSGNYAYVADYDNGLVIVDISDPSTPYLAGHCNTAGYAYGIAVSGNYAYVADWHNGLVIVDISDPSTPYLAGHYNTADFACGIAVSGSYAYVADGDNGLLIVDISDPSMPRLAGHYDTAGDAHGIAVSGSYAYIADGYNGLVIVDISDPSTPYLAGHYDTAGYARGIAVSGSYAYIADRYNGLVIVDINDPSTPYLAGHYDTGSAYGIAVSGNYAYVVDGFNGLVIVDINDPSTPYLAGHYDTAGDAHGIAVSGSYAYIADWNNGLVIVNISDPSTPYLAGHYDTIGDARGIAVLGSYAYIADGYNELVIVDISDPSMPHLIGHYDTTGRALGIAVSGNYAYIADGYNGLVVVDISAPSTPYLAGNYDTAGRACGIAVSGSYVYVADWHNGLVILRNDNWKNEWIDEDSELELVGEVPPTAGISIWHVEGMEVLDSNSDELFFTSKNQGADCGGGTPASVWKMTLDPNTGDMISVEHIQSLSRIQTTRGDLFESSDGTLFTGGGWCGYKPAYYSTDGGETWQTADSGSVHPPNSVFTFVEFNGDVYAGTGYEPYHGQVYRWLGDGNWELVLDIGIVRNIVDTMVVYDDQLFVGSNPYGYNGAACESTIPVLVSSDGNTFDPTAGIPGCCTVQNLFVVDNQLLARVHDRNSGQEYIYRWNDISETWEEMAAYNLEASSPYAMASHNGVIYTCGQAPSDASAGIYQSVDLGVTWQQIAVLENPDAYVMTIHDDTLYIGTWNDVNNKAYIYRKSLFGETMITSCDSDGKEKNQFEPGESVYVKGLGLEANTTYRILIQDDPVSEGDKLSADEDPSGPILWNKLGSLDEVRNSEVGANFIVEGNVGFTDGVFGNGFFSTGHWYLGNRIIIPENGLQLDPQGGTIEAWVMYPQDPIVWAYDYGMFGILDGCYQSGSGRDNTLGQQVINFIGDGVTGDLYTYYVLVNFGNTVRVEIPNIDQVFQPGDFHHVAIVWEKDGIDGSSNRIRVYIDNVLMGSSDDNNWGTDPDVGNRHTVAKGAGFDDGTPAFVIDNLEVWNYARTDFSDRFNETPSTFECVTTDADGSFDRIEIWVIPSDANPTADAFDIVADKLDDDPNTGRYNAASDSIDSATTVGFVALVPELPTLILFSIGLLVLVGYVSRKRF